MLRSFWVSTFLIAFTSCTPKGNTLVSCTVDEDCESAKVCVFGFCDAPGDNPNDAGRPDVDIPPPDVQNVDAATPDAQQNADVITLDAASPDAIDLGVFDPANFSHRIDLRLNMVSTPVDVEDAIVVLDLSQVGFDFDDAQVLGQDIRVFEPQRDELLSFETEAYAQDLERGFLWIKIPLARAQINSQEIVIYYGNSEVSDGQDLAGLWQDYLLVSHFDEGALTNSAEGPTISAEVTALSSAWGTGVRVEGQPLTFEEDLPESFTVQMLVNVIASTPDALLLESEGGNALFSVPAVDDEASFQVRYSRDDELVNSAGFSLADERALSIAFNSDDVLVRADGNIVDQANIIDVPFSAESIRFAQGLTLELDELRIREGEVTTDWERVHERARDRRLFVSEPLKDILPLAERQLERVEDPIVFFDFAGVDDQLVDEAGTLDAIEFDQERVERFNEGLRLLSAQHLEADGTELRNALQASGAFSIEAWLRPDHALQNGPARVVTLSRGPVSRTLTLAQANNTFIVRAVTSASDENGISNNALLRPQAPFTPSDQFIHVVATFADERLSIYVDGVGQSVDWPGTLSVGVDHDFSIANEVEAERPWLGDISLLAIYSRALSAEEINVNFAAGP